MKVISALNKKGGTGKSTLIRLLATELPKEDRDIVVKIADCDLGQGTCVHWAINRNANHPYLKHIAVESYADITPALESAEANYLLIDTPAGADARILKIAKQSDIILIPTGTGVDDLNPSVRFAYELRKHIPDSRISFVLTRVDSENELKEATAFIEQSGWNVLGHTKNKISLSKAMDAGKSIAESPYSAINELSIELNRKILKQL